MQMIIWMCGDSMKYRKPSEELRKMVGVDPVTTVIRSGKLRWCGHVMRKDYEDWVKNVWRSELKAEVRLEDKEGHG